eukprot:scpid43345/ scgid30289/ Bifunctional methylenetetrahydrofolate dehydrogenase/cyclohydrolase, mitochondrial; NAD-dependent methylenetetrahydrofolate dehydrogenase; Methenyltetrahydrofolate cyclohydrolase
MASLTRASRTAFRVLSCGSSATKASAAAFRNFTVSTTRFDAQLIDGKKISAEIRSEVKSEIDGLIAKGERQPKLAVVLVGEDGASATYVKAKRKACSEVGVLDETILRPTSITQTELMSLIADLNARTDVDGILCQLPLPDGMNERAVCDAIDPAKDVDGFSAANMGQFAMGQKSFVPATPAGVMELLKRYKVETFGKIVTIVGRSKNVGFPLANLLHSDGRYTDGGGDATVLQCHRFTEPQDLETCCRMSDIIIVATGVVGLIRGDMIKPGATVIDIGLTRVKGDDGKMKIVGDVRYDEAVKVAGLITPVPGGVGPMTVAMLCKNTLTAYQQPVR